MTHELYFEKDISFFDIKTFHCRVIAGERLNDSGERVYGLFNLKPQKLKGLINFLRT